jgi:hypothetical protein
VRKTVSIGFTGGTEPAFDVVVLHHPGAGVDQHTLGEVKWRHRIAAAPQFHVDIEPRPQRAVVTKFR